MSKFDWAKITVPGSSGSGDDGGNRKSTTSNAPMPKAPAILAVILILALVYGSYFWFVRRVVVPPGSVLVLLKKHGSVSLPGDQVVIPRAPDQKNAEAYKAWQERYGDCNGILEAVYPEGTYFGFSPFDYEREVLPAKVVPNGKVGVVVKKFGGKLDEGQVLADPTRDQRGPLPFVLQPARYNEYSNPYAYEVKVMDPVTVDPGHRGVVTIMAGAPAKNPNGYLVEDAEQGVQKSTEPEGFRYLNPYQKRIMPISVQSQRFEMAGEAAIRFPSSDSFEIRMEGFVEWSIMPEKLALLYTQYGEGGELLPLLEERVILPYARSFSRLVGSQFSARDFIAGDTKLRFQRDFETRLREECAKQGIEILQALVRDIIPPDEIKNPINEREVAKQQIRTLEQQIQVAKSSAALTTQTEIGTQNQKIGDANREVVSVVKVAERNRDVALTKARQDLAVAELRLEAAQKQADAVLAKGQAEAAIVLLNKQAEAEPLRQQVSAFGDGNSYAQFYFYQKVAPSMKSIISNTEGPFADLFKQFITPVVPSSDAQKVSK